jgi:predicted nucleic acid-binding protein
MTIIDANILLYAYNASAPQQSMAAAYIENLLNSGEPVAIPWVTAWAFVRIAANARIWNHPLPV